MEYIKRTALMILFLGLFTFCLGSIEANASVTDATVYVNDNGNNKGKGKKGKGKDKDKGPTTPVPAQEDIGGGYASFQ